MKKIKYLMFLFVLLVVLLLLFLGKTETNTYPSHGVLKWKGQNWYLTDNRSGPNNNYWNNTGEWIDNQNRLHLTIVEDEGIWKCTMLRSQHRLSLIHISEPTRRTPISYAVFCLKK